ncbi:tryptophan halogenase family protein [Lacimicrobium alkaliphilum]|uniref:Tryptophan halogenase n=1 Tax=Lacimicrobium alkaliphilum TaxID=1526571 RepID=A0ABQ1R1A6_9ALTE|nr:tryptophan halogenase family protein [Lacimicrobium alkaliphilum]GGD52756.1 tryptophan halogenase [Lacimicrobium alkaliphilum]
MTNNPIQNLVVVGGGTAGWMAATSLKNCFPQLNVTVIESSEIGTIGVGEATIPTIRRFYAQLGFTDEQVIKATQGTCKLGIQFNGWRDPKSSFIHPFGSYGEALNGVPFHHYWLKHQLCESAGDLEQYCVAVQLAKQNRFSLPPTRPQSALSVFDWALHLDAGLFATMLKQHGQTQGIHCIDAKVQQVDTDPENGFIRTLRLSDGQQVEGELFLDCSGFNGVLIEQTLKTGYQDWSQWLLCDSAVVAQSHHDGEPAPYTQANARTAGWQWKIPLQHRQGNGLVYSSQHQSDEQAETELKANIDSELLHPPRVLRFTPGRRNKAWSKNCIAVGLAAGFFEPVESTNIALIETAIEKIKLLFPDCSMPSSLVDEFNFRIEKEYESVRDFVLLHYCLNQRDEPFWQDYRKIPLPDTLTHRMQLFRANGLLPRQRHEIFQPNSWLALFDGCHYYPEQYDPSIERFPVHHIRQGLTRMRESISQAVERSPTHSDFLRRCLD